ncbi:MAG: helix-turn-helix domain-containing protein [Gammaproteobacteria bacterium]
MARTREFDEPQALEAAMRVFWEKGYEGTSIQDLEDAMSLGRTSIYNAFGNKRQVFNRTLECYKESVMSGPFEAMDSATDIREGVRRLLNGALDIHFDANNPGGCLVVLSILESEQHDVASSDSLARIIHDLKSGLQQRLRQAQQAGELSAELDVSATATTIATIMSGMMVMGKAHFTRPMLRKTVKQVLQLLA